MFIRSGFRHMMAIGAVLLALMLCSCSGSAVSGTNEVSAKAVSYVAGTVALTAPNSGQRVTGPFSAAVDSSLSAHCAAPYVEYWLWDGGSWNQCLGTGWTAPSFPKTLTPPAGKYAYYQLKAKLYAYDDSGPPYGPFLLDTDTVNILVDTD
jgi:hypothetical protein